MGTSRKYPYCKAHKLPLHKCPHCAAQFLPPNSIDFKPERGEKPKCYAHGACMERCPDCKEQLYSILPNCSTDKYLLVCDKIVPVKRPASSTSLPCVPLFSSAAFEASADTGGGFVPVTPEDSGKKAPKMQMERMRKKSRFERITFSKRRMQSCSRPQK